MAKSQNKTTQTEASVETFLNGVAHKRRADEAREIVEMMEDVTSEPPKMWGASIVGFGSYHYKYDSGREGDSFMTGVAPRKAALTIYVMPGFSQYDDLLAKLGPHTTGQSCLYIKNWTRWTRTFCGI